MKKISSTKILYIDTFSQKAAHEMFNASLILMYSILFERIDCRISKSSYDNFLKIINVSPPQNVRFSNVFVIEGESRFHLMMRYFISTIQNIRFLVFSSKDTIIIFPFNNLFSLRIINFLNKIYKRKILIFCHSEMEGIINDNSKGGFLHRMLSKLCYNFFLNENVKISENLYFSVLGDVLKVNIMNLLSEKKSLKFISIDHPYLFDSIVLESNKSDNLNISTVGAISKVKGLLSLVDFTNRIEPNIKKNINISIIGTTHENTKLLKAASIEFSSGNNGFLTRKEMGNLLMKLDYILFFYPKDSYKITSSGAIMDAIYYEKPILALKNQYFEYLFNKFGEFGYLFDSVDEMVIKVEEIYNNKIDEKFNFEILKSKFSPEVISQYLLKEMISIGFLKI